MPNKKSTADGTALTAATDPAIDAGRAHHGAGRLPEAEAVYRSVLAADPGNPDALNLLSALAHQTGRHEYALELLEQAIAARPDAADYRNKLGLAHQALGKLQAAEAAYRQAILLAPGHVAAKRNLGDALLTQGKLEDAVAAYRQALQLQPDHAETLNGLAAALMEQGKLEDAVATYLSALDRRPDYAEAHNNLGVALKNMGRLEEAVAAFRAALEARADYAAAHNNLGNALKDQGNLEDALGAYRAALKLNPSLAEAHSNLLYCMLYQPGYDRAVVFAEYRKWNAQHAAPLAPKAHRHRNLPSPEKRLRLGFVSRDFHRHPVGYLTLSALEALDKNAFELTCYADVLHGDELTERFKQAAHTWRSIAGLQHDDVAARIRDDGVDILVDMSGHGAGSRLLVFARKPAPVQVKWVGGQIDTTGLDAIDYFISDRIASPAGDDAWYSEEITRLPDGYVCYAPPDYAPAPAPLPALSQGHITFGCFNNLSKLNHQVIALWCRLLARVAGSRLVLKTRQLNDTAVAARYRAMFERNGIAPDRLDLSGESPHGELLAAYNDIDIALDPLPYSGGLTTCEALWMGVPVVTLPGVAFAHRHAASHLHAAGLDDWVAETAEQNLDIAVRHCGDLETLALLRAGLRHRVSQSPLCDAPRFAGHLEAAFRTMWRRWCEAKDRSEAQGGQL